VGGLVAEVRLEQDAVETQPRPAVEERGAREAAGAGAAARRILSDLVWPPLHIAAPPRPCPARVARCAVQSSGPSAAESGGAAAGGGEKTAPPPAVGAAGSVQQRAERRERKGQVMDPARPVRRGHYFRSKTGPTGG
jgi:hypothetical protein